jgi:hypothetical protein
MRKSFVQVGDYPLWLHHTGRTGLSTGRPFNRTLHKGTGGGGGVTPPIIRTALLQPAVTRFVAPPYFHKLLPVQVFQTFLSNNGLQEWGYRLRSSARRELSAIAAQFTAMVKDGRRMYMLTHGMNDTFCQHCRRERFRKLLDTLRKDHRVLAYFWVTEFHEGGGPNDGTIHHHAIIITRGWWEYIEQAKRWSKLYSYSPNGVDIQAVSSAWYAAKYASKGTSDRRLPFRWWGTSYLKRSTVLIGVPMVAVTHPEFSEYAYTCRKLAADMCAKYNECIYLERWQRKLEKYRQRLRQRVLKNSRALGVLRV